MKLLLSILALSVLSGCAGPQLKRCQYPVTDATIMQCKEQVSGAYWKCVVPKDLRSCVSAL